MRQHARRLPASGSHSGSPAVPSGCLSRLVCLASARCWRWGICCQRRSSGSSIRLTGCCRPCRRRTEAAEGRLQCGFAIRSHQSRAYDCRQVFYVFIVVGGVHSSPVIVGRKSRLGKGAARALSAPGHTTAVDQLETRSERFHDTLLSVMTRATRAFLRSFYFLQPSAARGVPRLNCY